MPTPITRFKLYCVQRGQRRLYYLSERRAKQFIASATGGWRVIPIVTVDGLRMPGRVRRARRAV